MNNKQLLLLLGCVASGMYANVIKVNTIAEYDANVTNNPKPAIVKFAADWCSVCQGAEQPFEELSNENEFNNVNFVHVDIKKAEAVSEKNGIVGVPTFFYVVQGKKVAQEIGVQNMDTFKEDIRNNIREKLPLEVSDNQDETITIEVEKSEPVKESRGIMGTIKGALNWVICAVKMAVIKILEFIKGVFGWIKNLFGG